MNTPEPKVHSSLALAADTVFIMDRHNELLDAPYRQEKFFDAPVSFSLDGWKADLKELSGKDEAAQWAIGDLLLAPEDLGEISPEDDWKSPKAAKLKREAVRITKRKWTTLKNYKSICRKFPKEPADGSPSLRSDTLSYGVHVLVAPFNREDQVRLLQRAENEVKSGTSCTVDNMRDLIKQERKFGRLPKPSKDRPKSEDEVVKIVLSRKNYQSLEKIARVRNIQPSGTGSLVADVILWMVKQYCAENRDELNADIRALEEKEIAQQKAASEGNDRSLAQMDEDLANDVDNKIPSY
jgi:hypothetical protein